MPKGPTRRESTSYVAVALRRPRGGADRHPGRDFQPCRTAAARWTNAVNQTLRIPENASCAIQAAGSESTAGPGFDTARIDRPRSQVRTP